MLLVLDVGNTNTVLGVFTRAKADAGRTAADKSPDDGPRYDQLLANWRVATVQTSTVDEYGVLFRNLFAMAGLEVSGMHGIVISSVVPPLDPVLRQVCERYFNSKPLFIGPGMIVDFGTATTFDCVSAKGEYLGGVISPGLGISADALFERTARLPRVAIRKPARVIGSTTVGSLQSGLYYGYLGLVDGILQRLLGEMGKDATVVATGGLAGLIGTGSKHIKTVDDFLT